MSDSLKVSFKVGSSLNFNGQSLRNLPRAFW